MTNKPPTTSRRSHSWSLFLACSGRPVHFVLWDPLLNAKCCMVERYCTIMTMELKTFLPGRRRVVGIWCRVHSAARVTLNARDILRIRDGSAFGLRRASYSVMDRVRNPPGPDRPIPLSLSGPLYSRRSTPPSSRRLAQTQLALTSLTLRGRTHLELRCLMATGSSSPGRIVLCDGSHSLYHSVIAYAEISLVSLALFSLPLGLCLTGPCSHLRSAAAVAAKALLNSLLIRWAQRINASLGLGRNKASRSLCSIDKASTHSNACPRAPTLLNLKV
ncbi:hypothetical protein NMY22_g20069 [Coprinellus aureogranulatus]|nr:hypothetical protein NMY22_g20069 [Coprinellus aureogranulatus]